MSTFTACRIFLCPCHTCFISGLCNHPWLFYTLLITFYLGISVGMAFFPASGFHYREVYSRGKTDKKLLSLTFDDGPDPVNTPGILDVLGRFKVKAAFFIIGRKTAGNEGILRRIAGEGHLIGNHSWSHSYLWDLYSSSAMADDIERNIKETERITGKRMRFFRPPYGVINPMVAKAAGKTGVDVVVWSFRSFDTTARDPKALLDKTLRGARPGDIMLFHDSSALTAGILEKIIVSLQERGFNFIPLDEMLTMKAYENC